MLVDEPAVGAGGVFLERRRAELDLSHLLQNGIELSPGRRTLFLVLGPSAASARASSTSLGAVSGSKTNSARPRRRPRRRSPRRRSSDTSVARRQQAAPRAIRRLKQTRTRTWLSPRIAVDEFGHVDIMCNNAATPGKDLWIWEQTVDNWNATIAVDVTAAMLCTREVLNQSMLESGPVRSVILNFSSTAAFNGMVAQDPLRHGKGIATGLHQGRRARSRTTRYPLQLHRAR